MNGEDNVDGHCSEDDSINTSSVRFIFLSLPSVNHFTPLVARYIQSARKLYGDHRSNFEIMLYVG